MVNCLLTDDEDDDIIIPDMKYKITIYQIQTKKVLESVYISDDEIARRKKTTTTGETYPSKNYQTTEIEKEVADQIYEQIIEKDLDIKTVIDAFNK